MKKKQMFTKCLTQRWSCSIFRHATKYQTFTAKVQDTPACLREILVQRRSSLYHTRLYKINKTATSTSKQNVQLLPSATANIFFPVIIHYGSCGPYASPDYLENSKCLWPKVRKMLQLVQY